MFAELIMPNGLDPLIMKEAVKEAIKEWLTEQKAEVGLFTIKFMVCAFCAGCLYLFLVSQGWHK